MGFFVPLLIAAAAFAAGFLAERSLSGQSDQSQPIFYNLQPINYPLWIGISITIAVFSLVLYYSMKRR